MTARVFLGSILWILHGSVLPCIAAEAERSAPTIVAGPCLQNPGEGSMTIVWMTDRNCAGWVEYGNDETLGQKAVSSRDGLVDAYQRLHRVTLRGLEAGRTVHYRVVSKEIVDFQPYKVTYGDTVVSEVYQFTTLDPHKPSFSFIVLNDLHDKVDIMKRLLALADREPYDFVVLNGDIINDPQSEEQVVRVLLQPCGEAFGTRVPLVLVRGNHETRGMYARELKPFVRNPEENYYGAFTHGSVRLVILDSGEDKPDSEPVYADLVDFDRYRDAQREWLEEEIRGPEFRESRFQIAIVHIPLFGSGDRHGATDCRQKWGPLLQEGGTDLQISAHLHRHRIVEPEPGIHDCPVVIGGAPSPGAATLTRVDVSATALTVTMLNDEGEQVQACEVPVEQRESCPSE